MTTVTALPTPPSRLDPANFRERADDFFGALPGFVAQLNALAGELNTTAASTVAKVDLALLSGLATAATNAATALVKAAEAVAAASVAVDAKTQAQAAWTAALAANPDLDPPVRMNPSVVRADLAVPAGYNAYAAGPLEVAEGVIIDVADGGGLSIV